MNPHKKEYDITGRLTEDGKFIEIEHWYSLKRVLKGLQDVRLDIRIKPYKQKRSDAQNRYWWGVLIPTIRAWFYDNTGHKYTPSEIYGWIKTTIFGDQIEVKTIMNQEVFVMKEVSMSDMKTDEFAERVNQVIDYMAIKGCEIMLPEGNNDLYTFIERNNALKEKQDRHRRFNDRDRL